METLREFQNRLQKNTGKGRREFRIKNSWGVYDVYKHMRKNHWYDIGRPLKEKEYYAIVRQVNALLAEELKLGHTVKLPCEMGVLELRKHTAGVSIVDGKLKNTYPIDWDGTSRLWYENEEEREKKTLLRIEDPMVYYIKYCEDKAKYKNKVFYRFQVNRFIKRDLKDNIKKGITDTLW